MRAVGSNIKKIFYNLISKILSHVQHSNFKNHISKMNIFVISYKDTIKDLYFGSYQLRDEIYYQYYNLNKSINLILSSNIILRDHMSYTFKQNY